MRIRCSQISSRGSKDSAIRISEIPAGEDDVPVFKVDGAALFEVKRAPTRPAREHREGGNRNHAHRGDPKAGE